MTVDYTDGPIEQKTSFLLLLQKKKKNAYSFDTGENYIVTARSQCQCKEKMKNSMY